MRDPVIFLSHQGVRILTHKLSIFFISFDAIPSSPNHCHYTGILVVDVSTIGAADERCWANAERQLPGFSSLQVRATFGPGSAVASAPWACTAPAVGQEDGSDQLRRGTTVRHCLQIEEMQYPT